jgi:hypothetical protein
MSANIIHGFVVQEVLYSQDLRRVCCVCGAKRKIQFLSQKSVVFKGDLSTREAEHTGKGYGQSLIF